jgi:hypothetical protein
MPIQRLVVNRFHVQRSGDKSMRKHMVIKWYAGLSRGILCCQNAIARQVNRLLLAASMDTGAYILAGCSGNPAFASSSHGAGRAMNRRQAVKH